MSSNYLVPPFPLPQLVRPKRSAFRLPYCLPRIPEVDYYVECQPAEQAGGDFFDFKRLSEDCLAIAIGHISSKATPVAFSGIQASLRGLAIQPTGCVAEIVRELNCMICESRDDFYASLFYAQFDLRRRELEYVNAGHEPPLLFGNGAQRVRRLQIGGTVLGLTPKSRYQQGKIQLDSENMLVAFTDGICEATNRRGEEWGESRLIETIRAMSCPTAVQLVREVQESVEEFRAGQPRVNDRTLLAFRSLGPLQNRFGSSIAIEPRAKALVSSA